MDALERAIKLAGGLTAFANQVRQSPQTIVNWRKRGVPAERVLDIERAMVDPNTGYPRISRHEIRADIYPEEDA